MSTLVLVPSRRLRSLQRVSTGSCGRWILRESSMPPSRARKDGALCSASVSSLAGALVFPSPAGFSPSRAPCVPLAFPFPSNLSAWLPQSHPASFAMAKRCSASERIRLVVQCGINRVHLAVSSQGPSACFAASDYPYLVPAPACAGMAERRDGRKRRKVKQRQQQKQTQTPRQQLAASRIGRLALVYNVHTPYSVPVHSHTTQSRSTCRGLPAPSSSCSRTMLSASCSMDHAPTDVAIDLVKRSRGGGGGQPRPPFSHASDSAANGAGDREKGGVCKHMSARKRGPECG